MMDAVFVLFVLPETRGVLLEDMGSVFGDAPTTTGITRDASKDHAVGSKRSGQSSDSDGSIREKDPLESRDICEAKSSHSIEILA